MSQNENYDAIIVGICHDAAVLAELWEAVRTLFMDYAEDVIAKLTPIAEAFSNPFGIEEPSLSQEAIESQITTLEDMRQHFNAPIKKCSVKDHRRPQRVQMHYNYIPRVSRNLPYQRRTF